MFLDGENWGIVFFSFSVPLSNNIFLFPRVTSNVTKMNGIFYGATKFNSDISRWYSNNIKNLMISISIPDQASEALDNLDAPSSNPAAGNFCSFFFCLKVFSLVVLHFFRSFLPISTRVTSKVTTMNAMFYACSMFTSDLTMFDTSKVTRMNSSKFTWIAIKALILN